jgi:hypothetical protein
MRPRHVIQSSIASLGAIVLALYLLSTPQATAQHGGGGQWCGCSQPSNGIVYCGATCKYPHTCSTDTSLGVGAYCYDDFVGACFDGQYDQCCDPNACMDHW